VQWTIGATFLHGGATFKVLTHKIGASRDATANESLILRTALRPTVQALAWYATVTFDPRAGRLSPRQGASAYPAAPARTGPARP